MHISSTGPKRLLSGFVPCEVGVGCGASKRETMSTASSASASHLDVESLRGLLDRRSDVILLDVRSPGEFASVHIEGSHNLPLDLLQEHVGDVVQRVQGPLAVICAQGVRSEQAGRSLSRAGAPDVRVLDGGIQAWEADGGDVIRGDGTWAMDRQVRLVAGSIVLAGVLASVVRPKTKWISAAVGAGLTYSAISNSCAMAKVLGYLPYNARGPRVDLRAALETLTTAGRP